MLLINNLLPSKGDYSQFKPLDFLQSFLSISSVIGIVIFVLWLINKKINLFDIQYPFSRAYLNSQFIITSTVAFCFTIIYLINLIIRPGSVFSSVNFIKNIIMFDIVSVVSIYLINFRPLMIRENSMTQNIINYFGVKYCNIAFYAFVFTIINMKLFTNTVDFLRTIIIELMIAGVLAFVLYWINFKSQNDSKEKPQAFNIDR